MLFTLLTGQKTTCVFIQNYDEDRVVVAQTVLSDCMSTSTIGHVNEYPTMHNLGISRHTQSMIVYSILTEYFWKFQGKFS